MRREYCFYTYIMASLTGVLYIGITNNLHHRARQHKQGTGSAFTKKYDCNKLVYYEEYQYVEDAIAREKQLKRWRREKKIKLIMTRNPEWKDLSDGWYEE